jgi:hypothetical protein
VARIGWWRRSVAISNARAMIWVAVTAAISFGGHWSSPSWRPRRANWLVTDGAE